MVILCLEGLLAEKLAALLFLLTRYENMRNEKCDPDLFKNLKFGRITNEKK